jgi:hypothetical protein
MRQFPMTRSPSTCREQEGKAWASGRNGLRRRRGTTRYYCGDSARTLQDGDCDGEGFRTAAVRPTGALYEGKLGLFMLPYAAVRSAPDREAILLEFLQSTYEAAANLARWNRAELECPFREPCVPRQV